MKRCRALDLLRSSTTFLTAIESTAPACDALQRHAHLLRALADPRPLTERIAWSVRYTVPLLVHMWNDPATVRGVQKRLAEVLPMLPLVDVPDARSLSRAMKRVSEQNAPVLSDTQDFARHASSVKST
jgi:hypothetical protein